MLNGKASIAVLVSGGGTNLQALIDAAKRTLERRGDSGTGWSRAWKINFWARLRDKDKVIKLIDNQLRYIKLKVIITKIKILYT